MNQEISEHIHIKASIAVLIVDDFSDKILNHSGIQVRILGAGKPIRKSDGYYIFTNIMDKTIQLEVEALYYNKETVSISMEKLNPLSPVVKVRIKPNRSYGIPAGTTCMEGTAKPDSTLRFVFPQSMQFRKLLYDYKKTDKENKEFISLFNPEGADLEGMEFFITDKDGAASEYLKIVGAVDVEESKYQLEYALKHEYKKMGTKLYSVYVTKTNEEGSYFLPIREIKTGSALAKCCVIQEDFQKEEIDMEAGKVNKYNFK